MTGVARVREAGARLEDLVAFGAAVAIMALPLSEVVLRRAFNTGVPGSAPFTTHLTLVLGLVGAAIAARRGKLLALATTELLPAAGRLRAASRTVAALAGAAVAATLALASVSLVEVHRRIGSEIALGVPVWVFDLAFPVAFSLIALRLIARSSSAWTGRAIAALGVPFGLWLATTPEALFEASVGPWIAGLIVVAALGMPIFALLGGAAAILFVLQGDSPATAIVGSYDQLTSTHLPALPLFTLAGFLLARGQASSRLLRLFRAGLGWMPGGTAIVTAALCAFFTVLTGGSGVTILALGGLLMPALLADRYSERFSLGLLTASGSLGLLLPPALPLMLYGIVAGVAIGDLFVAGLLPGLVMLGLIAALGVRRGLIDDTPRSPFRLAELLASAWHARWELVLPVVVLGALFLGATTVQTAAVAALYALVVQWWVQRDLVGWRDVRDVTSEATALIGGVLVILAVAVGFTDWLFAAEVPSHLVAWVRESIDSPAMFLLALNGVLLLVGCVVDIFSAMVVVVPLIVPVAEHFGIDPVHLGIIIVANLELGYLTPPVGINLFLSAYRFEKPVFEVARATLPMLLILAVGVLLITYWPPLTTGILAWWHATP